MMPWDTLGLSILKERDLNEDEDINNVYRLDLMPRNNCLHFQFTYRDGTNDPQFALNYSSNFGDGNFRNRREEFFNFGSVR